jgi:hypothetical protein
MGYMRTMILLADQIKTARTDAIKLHGDKYQEKVGPYKDAIIKHMAATGMEALDSTFKLAKTSIDYKGDPMMYLAAGVELVMGGGAA